MPLPRASPSSETLTTARSVPKPSLSQQRTIRTQRTYRSPRTERAGYRSPENNVVVRGRESLPVGDRHDSDHRQHTVCNQIVIDFVHEDTRQRPSAG